MSEQVARLKAALADSYEIERELGAGGMATVFVARDLKHDRRVAVKVLRPELAAVLGGERFLRKVRVTANLQHPHILPLHDSGEASGFLYYVMPYVEGQSLRERLAREGELPIHEAVRILRDVTDALSHAHTHGVVHRDIKPDNVLLSGRHALVTDFGVAKAVSEATGRDKLTTAGIALGTPAYMAPEQAAADPQVDHRADIYAVGALAYEVLTGRPPFLGTTPQMVLSAHITEAPQPVITHRESVPPALNDLIMICLQKKPADRWQSADQLLMQLEVLVTPGAGMTPTDTTPIRVGQPRRSRLTVAVAGAMAVVMAGVAGLLLVNHEPPLAQLSRMTKLTSTPGLELDPAISPDGMWVAYAAGPVGRTHILLQQVTGGRAIDLTEGLAGRHRWPQWSPDGERILFQADDAIYVMQALGGVPRLVARPGASPAWSPDGGEIIYEADSIMYRQPVDGGDATSPGSDYDPHSFTWSPDGSRIAYVSGNSGYVLGTRAIGGSYQTTLKSLVLADQEYLDLSGSEYMHLSPVWAGDDQLLYVSDEGGTRDIYQLGIGRSGRPTGQPRRVTAGLDVLTMSLSADASRLAYSVFEYDANIWSIRIPTGGTVSVAEAEPVTSGSQYIEGISVSPDGRWLTYDSNLRGNQDIYRLPLDGGEPEQLTTDPGQDYIPSWSPSGEEIAFYSFRHGSRDIFLMTADGRSVQRLTDFPGQERYPDWSPDENRIVFMGDMTGRSELHIISRQDRSSGWSAPLQITFDGGSEPRWAPDGRWIAYVTQGSLRVVPPEGGEPRILASEETSDGWRPDFPEWSSDGRTVFYWARRTTSDASIWGVPVSGGRPRLLVRFDDPSKPPNRDEFTADASHFYFTLGRRESDVWIAEVGGIGMDSR